MRPLVNNYSSHIFVSNPHIWEGVFASLIPTMKEEFLLLCVCNIGMWICHSISHLEALSLYVVFGRVFNCYHYGSLSKKPLKWVLFLDDGTMYEGRLKSSWTHLITPSRNFVEVR